MKHAPIGMGYFVQVQSTPLAVLGTDPLAPHFRSDHRTLLLSVRCICDEIHAVVGVTDPMTTSTSPDTTAVAMELGALFAKLNTADSIHLAAQSVEGYTALTVVDPS